jgi:hypothetical protein
MNGIDRLIYAFDTGLKDSKIVWALKENDPPEMIAMLVADLLNMKQEDLKLDSIWRVKVYPDGFVEINDFTMPSKTGKLIDKISQAEVPDWIRDALAVLQIVDDGTVVDGVGRKISEQIYYITERKYGNQARSKGKEGHKSPIG